MYRVMLVDDEPGILSALRRVLSSIPADDLDGEKLTIETFESPREARKRIDDARFDLVISDYRMPDMSGLMFLRSVIERQPHIARILLSGYADLEGIIGAINQAQIFRFIGKPWHDYELKSAVVQALHHHALLAENQRLADTVRVQKEQLSRHELELRRLENECPGITRVKRLPDGSILLEED